MEDRQYGQVIVATKMTDREVGRAGPGADTWVGEHTRRAKDRDRLVHVGRARRDMQTEDTQTVSQYRQEYSQPEGTQTTYNAQRGGHATF